ncbi:MAG: dUTP diphosphatase [Candidatus Paracaedibacteraceae bacterium]|nr:dUTP diphosphatase [Candidatus Paracaedibacteraceae bacterium]
MKISIQRFPHAVDFPLPAYATEGSAGLDLIAAISEDVIIGPGERAMIPTGIAIHLPVGYEAQIRSRSGLAAKNGIIVLNAPGTIDSDYRGEICVVLANTDDKSFVVAPGMRVAQMVVAPYTTVTLHEDGAFDMSTTRGIGGFGSTGL